MDPYLIFFLIIAAGCLFLAIIAYLALNNLLKKNYRKASAYGSILLAVAIIYGIYQISENYRLNLLKPQIEPAKNSLVPNPDSIPKFLVEDWRFFNGFVTTFSYRDRKISKDSEQKSLLYVSYKLFNFFQNNCDAFNDNNHYLYRNPTEILKTAAKKPAKYYFSNSVASPYMKLTSEDEFGCIEIYSEPWIKELKKEDLLNILNSLIRVHN